MLKFERGDLMKRIGVILLILILLFSGCGSRDSGIVVSHSSDGTADYVLDRTNSTVTMNDQVYTFESDYKTVTITYPNGATWYRTTEGSFAHSGWSDDYDPERYVPGDTLYDIIYQAPKPKRTNPGVPIFSILCILIGIVNTAFPYVSRFLRHGLHVQNAEPTDDSLTLIRIGGVVSIILGIVLLIL